MCLFAEKSVILPPMNRNWLHLIYIYILSAVLVVTVVGCHSDPVEPTPPSPGRPFVRLPRTLIVYMSAENTLSSFARYDSMEIAQGLSNIGQDHRVAVYIDDVKSSRLCVGMREQPLQLVKTYQNNICSTDSADMSRVLNEIVKVYPAEHYGLILWSHASGWVPSSQTTKTVLRSFGADNGHRSDGNNNGPSMNITTLAHVLEKLPHFDFVLFDACFMQCVEVAYQLRHVTDYVIGSPAELPGDGGAYVNLLQPMCQIPTNVDRLLEYYVDYYLNGGGRIPYTGAEISAIRTDKVEALAAASAPYIQRIFGGRRSPECGNVQKYYVGSSHTSYTEYYDFKNLMFHHLSAEEYAEWCEAYDAAVPLAPLTPTWYSAFSPADNHICKIADLGHTGGVSLFVPSEEYARKGWVDKYHGYDWYHATGMENTGW